MSPYRGQCKRTKHELSDLDIIKMVCSRQQICLLLCSLKSDFTQQNKQKGEERVTLKPLGLVNAPPCEIKHPKTPTLNAF